MLLQKSFINFTLLKKCEQSYFTKYFQTNAEVLKNTWRDIKKAMSQKKTSNSVPSAVLENNITLTNPQETANAFKNYFVNNLGKQSQRYEY